MIGLTWLLVLVSASTSTTWRWPSINLSPSVALFTYLLLEILLRLTGATAVSYPTSRHRDPLLAITTVTDVERR